MANYVFGIDVGGTSVKCGLFQTDGTLLEKWEIPTRTENGGSEILPDIAKSVKAKMGEKGIAADDVAGVGIDVPGPVNDKGELSIAVNLNWGYKNIVKELSDELGGMAVKAANDANAAALGEMWAGGGKGSKNLVMVTLGTGVGGGIIVDGKIVAGAHGAGGEVGHACVDPEEEAVCNCGNHGCLEQMTSATGIVRLAKKYLASHDTPSSLRERGESISAKAVFDALKEGDAAAEAILAELNKVADKADVKSLVNLIESAKKLLDGNYTSDSLKDLKAAIKKAEDVIANPNRTEAEIGTAYADLINAILNLQMKANKAALKAILDKANEVLGNADAYVAATIDGLDAAAAEAQPVYDNTDALQDDVDAAVRALTRKVADARLLGDVDNDGEVTTADSVALLAASAEITSLDADAAAAADVNGDGVADTNDAVLILQYTAEKVASF